MNLETASEKFRIMGEAVKAAAVSGKQTEGSIEAEVISK